MNEKEGLLTLIKRGSLKQQQKAITKLGPQIIEAGDFRTANELIQKYPNLEFPAGVETFMFRTSNKFIEGISFTNAVKARDDIVDYLKIDNAPYREEVIEQFPLMAVLGAHQYMQEFMLQSHMIDKELFPDVLQFYQTIESIKEIKDVSGVYSGRDFPHELKAAIGVASALKNIEKNNWIDNKYELEEVDIIVNSKVPYSTAKRFIEHAVKGYQCTFTEALQDIRANSVTGKFIKALQPLATLVSYSKHFDKGEYKHITLRGKFEEESEIYNNFVKYIPVFELEELRLNSEGMDFRSAQSERLFEIQRDANKIVRPFADFVVENHLDDLDKKYAK